MSSSPASNAPRTTEAVTGTGTDVAGGMAQELHSLLEESERSAEKLSTMLDQTERARTEIAEAGAHLERYLHRGSQLLAALKHAKAETAPRPAADEPETAESLKHQLTQLISESEHLEAARAVAEAADRAKGCFLAAMSRELRTPVDGLARMIELLGQTRLDAEQKRYLRTANYSVTALVSLLDSVLSVSHLDGAIPDLRSTDFDLRRSLAGAVEALEPVARQKGLRLTCHVPTEVPTLVRGEPGKLRQVLFYAASRGIQFAGQGEVAVRAAVARTTDICTTIRFTVHHSDTDLSDDDLDRAFASHAQVDGAPLNTSGGTGLGLAIARQILDLLGGQIAIERDPARGFTIWFTIPLDNYLKPADDRRAHGRLPQELLQSSLGPVLDLSMSGIRIRASKPPKGEVEVELLDIEEPITLRAEVMWVRRLGFRKYEVGLNFMGVPPEKAKQLTRISLNHRLRRLLGIG